MINTTLNRPIRFVFKNSFSFAKIVSLILCLGLIFTAQPSHADEPILYGSTLNHNDDGWEFPPLCRFESAGVAGTYEAGEYIFIDLNNDFTIDPTEPCIYPLQHSNVWAGAVPAGSEYQTTGGVPFPNDAVFQNDDGDFLFESNEGVWIDGSNGQPLNNLYEVGETVWYSGSPAMTGGEVGSPFNIWYTTPKFNDKDGDFQWDYMEAMWQDIDNAHDYDQGEPVMLGSLGLLPYGTSPAVAWPGSPAFYNHGAGQDYRFDLTDTIWNNNIGDGLLWPQVQYDHDPLELTVVKNGSGSGTVTSNPAGIDCGATCVAPFARNTSVTLSAAPGVGELFTGWAGSGCSGTGTCTVTMDDYWTVTATFENDSDGDGEPDITDGCPLDPAKTDPGVCGCGVADTDTDGDGTEDCDDLCPGDTNKSAPGICGCGVADTDSDGDGTPDCFDGCPLNPSKILPGACGCGSMDMDVDGDGNPDCFDNCPFDPTKTDPGVCGCGVADTDSDGDGVLDCNDLCPDDPGKTEPGECGCGTADRDSDGDGVLDCNDLCPDDPVKTSPGICGCNKSDADEDGNGIPDCQDRGNWPPDMDLDANGVPDKDQDDLLIMFSEIEGLYFGVRSPDGGVMEYLAWVDAATITDDNGRPEAEFPLGVLTFRLRTAAPGKAILLTVYCSEPIPEDAVWYKYDEINGWYDFSSYVFVSEDRLSMILLVQDGGFGDADLKTNGFIEDPIGPAVFDDQTDSDNGVNDGTKKSGHHSSSGGCFMKVIFD